jgi:hypothetical protein
VLQIPSSAIKRVRVDEIEKEKPGGDERIACNDIKRYRE